MKALFFTVKFFTNTFAHTRSEPADEVEAPLIGMSVNPSHRRAQSPGRSASRNQFGSVSQNELYYFIFVTIQSKLSIHLSLSVSSKELALLPLLLLLL
jgi:hypothetical protein